MISELRNKFRYGNPILRLIFINVGVFIFLSVLELFFYFAGKNVQFEDFISKWFWVSSDLHTLLTRPWTLITHMFMHNHLDVFHILFNMLYLFFFGRILMDFLQKKNVVPLYITCGLAGALISIALYNVLPRMHDEIGVPAVGASAAVMGIVLAATALAPNYTVFLFFIGPVKLKYIALFLIIVDMVSIPSEINFGGHVAHLGGAITGFLFIRSYQNGIHWFDWIFRIEDRMLERRNKKPRVVYVNKEGRTPPPLADAERQKRLDAILDKISRSGYESLSKNEKDFLFKMSNGKK